MPGGIGCRHLGRATRVKTSAAREGAALARAVSKLAVPMGVEPTSLAVPWTVRLIQGGTLPLSYGTTY